MARDEIPAYVVIAELVCSAILLALNSSFFLFLPLQFGSGFQVQSMMLAEAVILLSLGAIAHVWLFVLFPQAAVGTPSRLMWVYIFAVIWVRILAFCSILALVSGAANWYRHHGAGGGVLPGPMLWGVFAGCLALAGRARIRRMEADDGFVESDRLIGKHAEWLRTRLIKGGLTLRRKLRLRQIPTVILVLVILFVTGLACLLLGITGMGRREVFALVPLLLGAVLAAFPFYWLALLASQLRGKPLTLVALLEGELPAVARTTTDPLTGQRTILLLIGLFSLVPLAVASVLETWGGFVFAVVAGSGGFVGLDLMRQRLDRHQKAKPLPVAEFEHARQRLARRGCDYGLILLVGGLLVVNLAPGLLAWDTGAVGNIGHWWKLAFPVWAWLLLAALSCWYERVVKPVWPDEVDPTAGLRLTEIITWPFQLCFFLNPWEILIRLRKKPTPE